jgi:alpha-beta hydrolase superfamily lysophospholipase
MLFVPYDSKADDPRGGIVLCTGTTGIKEVCFEIAETFCNEGFVVLTFDYRGFGESGGQRGRMIWYEQVIDIRNAITYMRTRPEVDRDRVGLWGSSYGGALAPYAFAMDERAAACVGELGFADGYASTAMRLGEDEIRVFKAMLEEDRERRVLHNDPMYADLNALSGDPTAVKQHEEMEKEFPQLKNRQIILQSLDAHAEFSPLSVIEKKGDRPLLLMAAELDSICPWEEYKTLYDTAPEPKEWILFENVNHPQFYEGENRERSNAEALSFFKQHLCMPSN